MKIEKDALKIKKETAKRMEKEAARLEKLSKSNERLGSRSGSLERRKSGEEGVTNQFTIHGRVHSVLKFKLMVLNLTSSFRNCISKQTTDTFRRFP